MVIPPIFREGSATYGSYRPATSQEINVIQSWPSSGYQQAAKESGAYEASIQASLQGMIPPSSPPPRTPSPPVAPPTTSTAGAPDVRKYLTDISRARGIQGLERFRGRLRREGIPAGRGLSGIAGAIASAFVEGVRGNQKRASISSKNLGGR